MHATDSVMEDNRRPEYAVPCQDIASDAGVGGYVPPSEPSKSTGQVVGGLYPNHAMTVENHPTLKDALDMIPLPSVTNKLVDCFINKLNFYHWVVSPAIFGDEYSKWWSARRTNRPLNIEFTCLLMIVCASALPYVDADLRQGVPGNLVGNIDAIAKKLVLGSYLLRAHIPRPHDGLINLQHLLSLSFWYYAEGSFIQCRYALEETILLAQRMGYDNESVTDGCAGVELDMRRRIWCVMDAWDWHVSSFIGQRFIIERSKSRFHKPNLVVETPNKIYGGYHPLTPAQLRCGLSHLLCSQLGDQVEVITARDVQQYRRIIEMWMMELPPTLRFSDADMSLDMACPWVTMQRHEMRMFSLHMLLHPMRPFLTKTFTGEVDGADLNIRSVAVRYSLELVICMAAFFEFIYPHDTTYRSLLLCLFDTATVLCSALIHDVHYNLPQRQTVYLAIDNILGMLLCHREDTEQTSVMHITLWRIAQHLPHPIYSVAPELTPDSHFAQNRSAVPWYERPCRIMTHLPNAGCPQPNGVNGLPVTLPPGSIDLKLVSPVPLDFLDYNPYTIFDPTARRVDWSGVRDRHRRYSPPHDRWAAPVEEPCAPIFMYIQHGIAPESLPKIIDADIANLHEVWDWVSLNLPFIVAAPRPFRARKPSGRRDASPPFRPLQPPTVFSVSAASPVSTASTAFTASPASTVSTGPRMY